MPAQHCPSSVGKIDYLLKINIKVNNLYPEYLKLYLPSVKYANDKELFAPLGYKVIVKTSNEFGSGTDATVKIKIKGTRLNLAARELKGSFERRRCYVYFNEYWIHSIVPIKVRKYLLIHPLVVFPCHIPLRLRPRI